MKRLPCRPAFAGFFLSCLLLAPPSRMLGQAFAGDVPYFGAFKEAALAEIRPEGWLREYLRRQADGLTGHLEAAGHPFNSTGWYDTTMAKYGWVVYEQNAYWVDGMLRCGRLLDDSVLNARALRQINYVLDHPDSDGYLGPLVLKKPGPLNRWPHVVFFRALMAEYGKTGDPGILEALRRHYFSHSDPFTSHRNIINVEIMLWTYAKTHDVRLLAMAEQSYGEYNRISREVTTLARMKSDALMNDFHGVTFNETAKLAAILYLYTGNGEYLEAVEHAYAKVDEHYMLIDGVLSSTEGMKGNGPLESHETCDIADYTWSLGYLLMATGKAEYADKIERACFNAAPGAVTKDFKALQYFSCPNQVIADKSSNHNEFFHGSAWMSYRPNPGTECCPGDVNRTMPNFACRLWMTDSAGAPVAALFAPSRFNFKVGNTPVSIVEETAYPFEEEVHFTIVTTGPVVFPLLVRIPGWCATPEISILNNGTTALFRPGSGRFERIEREFNNGDRITLRFPMSLKVSSWPEGGVGVERGPLVFALSIPANTVRDTTDRRSTPSFPAWNMEPEGPWNFALSLYGGPLEKQIEVLQSGIHGYPWEANHAPVALRLPARRVNGWSLADDPAKPGRLYTPHLPHRERLRDMLSPGIDTLTLIPYGCTLLRQTIFPLAGKFAPVTGRSAEPIFLTRTSVAEDSLRVELASEAPGTEIRYTLDGSDPDEHSPLFLKAIMLTSTGIMKARAYGSDADPSFMVSHALSILHRKPSVKGVGRKRGISFASFEGSWEMLPDFSLLDPASRGSSPTLSLHPPNNRQKDWGMVYRGYVAVPRTGLYRFILTSDDGSRLLIDGSPVIDNDGRHAMRELPGYQILEAGKHRFELRYFQGSGGAGLSLDVITPGGKRQPLPEAWLWHD
jgi:hypothetical protein